MKKYIITQSELEQFVSDVIYNFTKKIHPLQEGELIKKFLVNKEYEYTEDFDSFTVIGQWKESYEDYNISLDGKDVQSGGNGIFYLKEFYDEETALNDLFDTFIYDNDDISYLNDKYYLGDQFIGTEDNDSFDLGDYIVYIKKQ
jgi:hypothetical protein